MGMVSSFLINQVVEEHHPILNSENCINRLQKRFPCTICKDICPTNVFQQVRGEVPKWNQCINCNLCVTACPSRCITADPANLKSYLTGYDNTGFAAVGCEMTDIPVKIRESCVASIPWEFIAFLALRIKVAILLPCSKCDNEEGKKLLDSNMEALTQFLGPELFAERIVVVHSGEELPPEMTGDVTMTRTEVFSRMRSQMTTQALRAVANVNVDDYNGLFYRRLLADASVRWYNAAQESGGKSSFGVKLPHFTSKCYTCDNCVRLCPQKALSFGEPKNGKRGIYIEPWKCTGCDVCRHVCMNGGIDEMRYMRVPHLTKLLVTRVNVRLCENCGKPLRPESKDNLCPFCRSKEKTKARNAGTRREGT